MGWYYINRGKMNMREVSLQAINHGKSRVAVVFEKHGNPNRITFYDTRGKQLGHVIMNVAIPKNTLRRKGTSTVKGDLENIRPILNLMSLTKNGDKTDFWLVKKASDDYISVIEFYHNNKPTGFKIFIKRVHVEG